MRDCSAGRTLVEGGVGHSEGTTKGKERDKEQITRPERYRMRTSRHTTRTGLKEGTFQKEKECQVQTYRRGGRIF